MKAQRVFENIGFERGQIPQKTLKVGKYRTTPRTFKDYEGEEQTIEVDQENTFDLYDMKVKLVFKKKEGEEFANVYINGKKNDFTVFKMVPFDYEFKRQGEHSDPGFTSYGFPVAKDEKHLEELKEKYSHWIAMSGDYSRENRDPFIAVAELILFTY